MLPPRSRASRPSPTAAMALITDCLTITMVCLPTGCAAAGRWPAAMLAGPGDAVAGAIHSALLHVSAHEIPMLRAWGRDHLALAGGGARFFGKRNGPGHARGRSLVGRSQGAGAIL